MIEWSKKYSVGIKSIDDQHIKLIEIYNAYAGFVKAGKEFSAITETVDHLLEYCKVHFIFEEEMLHTFSWGNYVEHRKLHNKLIEDLVNYKIRIVTEPGHKLLLEINEFVKNWLNNHILIEDKKYAVFMAGKQFK